MTYFFVRKIWLLSLLSILIFSNNSYSETISGRVVNKTLDRPESGCEVSLIQHGGESAEVLKVTTDTGGRFSFEAEHAEGDVHNILSASYKGIAYRQNVAHAHGEPVEIAVYETSDSDSALTVISHHLVIDDSSREVTQIIIVRNQSDRTFRTGGDHGHGLEIPLPDGVTSITGGAEGLHAHGDILVSPEPVRPGGSQLIFTHQLSDGSRFRQRVNYPTGSVDVLMTPPDAEIEATGLQDLGEVAFQQRNFRRFRGAALEKGSQIILRLGVPSTDLEEYLSRDTLKWSLGGLAVAFGLLAVFYRRRPSKGGDGRDVSDLPNRRQVFLRQIADLDDRHEDGEIGEQDYRARRGALMAEVVDLEG
jgi:hypothetical protein